VGPFAGWILQPIGEWSWGHFRRAKWVVNEQALRFAFKANNNQVEYEALIVRKLLAKELGA